jgi:hypothetical protein
MEDIKEKWSDMLYLERNVLCTVFRGKLKQYRKEMSS